MAAFDLGLALVSFVVVWILQARALAGYGPEWPVALFCGLAMLIGGHVTSRFEPPTEHIAWRFIRRALVPLLVAFPVASLPFAVLTAFAGGRVGFPMSFVLTLLGGIASFGLSALVVTTLWALAYVGVERRVAAR